MGLLPAFGFVDRRVQVFDGDVVLVPTHPNYKEFLKYMNRLYEEGLMNPDYFTTTEEERIAVEASKQCGSFTDWCQWGYMTDFDDWFQWQAIDPLTSEFNSTKMWPGVDVALTYNLCITNKCENVEKLLELVDWFYTDEGILAEGEGQCSANGKNIRNMAGNSFAMKRAMANLSATGQKTPTIPGMPGITTSYRALDVAGRHAFGRVHK